MDDLISRKELFNKINAYVVGSQDKEFICKLIAEMPTIDAVEVVRCKDCDNFQTDWETAFANGRHYCAIIDSIMPPDGFCSYGERKNDG